MPYTVRIFTVVTSISVGVGVIVIPYLYSKLNDLAKKVSELQKELSELKTALSVLEASRHSSKFLSIHGSSGDDDDEFLEAYGSDYEFPSSSNYDSFSSTEDVIPEQQFYQNVDGIIDKTDADKRRAYAMLKSNKTYYGDNVSFQWRYAKAMYYMSQIEGATGNSQYQKSLIYEARDIAQHAIDADAANANAHKWYAILIGSVSDYESTHNKIKIGYKFKSHIDSAIQLEPDDPSPYYLLGRWCYSVQMLSWVERQVASTLFATPPTSSIDEALTHFMKAEKLSDGIWKENMLYIAKCLIQKSDYSAAISWLDRAKSTPVITVDDRESQAEVESLLYKYGGYRQTPPTPARSSTPNPPSSPDSTSTDPV